MNEQEKANELKEYFGNDAIDVCNFIIEAVRNCNHMDSIKCRKSYLKQYKLVKSLIK